MEKPKDIKSPGITKLSVFRLLSKKLDTRIDQLNSIQIKNQELFEREITNFRGDFEDKKHLFGRELTDNEEITEILKLMGHDTFIRLQYPNLIRQTMLTAVFTTFEIFSRQLIKLTEEHTDLKVKFNDLNNTGGELEQVKKYFTLVHNIEYKDVEKEWRILHDLKTLRNFIAHYSGYLLAFEQDKGAKKQKSLKQLIKRRKMEIRENALFLPNKNEFSLISMRACKSYFKHICKSLEAITNNPTVHITRERLDDGTIKEIKTEV